MAGKKTVKKENVAAVEPVVKKEEEKIVDTAEKVSAASVAPAEMEKVEAAKAVKAVKACGLRYRGGTRPRKLFR